MEWRPKAWLAALLSVLIAPLGLLYVQRWRLAVSYFVGSLAMQLIAMAVLFRDAEFTGNATLALAGFGINIVAAAHAFMIARAGAQSPERQWYSRWHGLIAGVFVLYLPFILIRAFLFEPFRTPSEAMYPTLPKGSVMLVKKLGYGDYRALGLPIWKSAPTVPVRRGELLLFRRVGDDDTVYVKRVIGLPGDHVECRGPQLFINGVAVPTTLGATANGYQYATELIDGVTATVAHLSGRFARDCDELVPQGHYYFLGDNRSNSRDSRYLGAVPRDRLVGRVVKGFSPEPAPAR